MNLDLRNDDASNNIGIYIRFYGRLAVKIIIIQIFTVM